MQILKKNQVIIFVIALMFVAAGYLSFTSNNAIPTAKLANSEEMAAIGDATLVNANAITEEITEEKENKPSEEPVIGTSVQITQDEYFSQSRLDRDTMYSQMIESYQKILESDNVTTEQKNKKQRILRCVVFYVFCSVVTFIFQLFQIYLLFRLCFLLFFFFSSRSKYKHPVNAIAANPTKPYIQVPSEPVIGIKNT